MHVPHANEQEAIVVVIESLGKFYARGKNRVKSGSGLCKQSLDLFLSLSIDLVVKLAILNPYSPN